MFRYDDNFSMYNFIKYKYNKIKLTALLRQKSKAFRLWVNKMMESRDRSQVKEHSRLLSSSAASHTR